MVVCDETKPMIFTILPLEQQDPSELTFCKTTDHQRLFWKKNNSSGLYNLKILMIILITHKRPEYVNITLKHWYLRYNMMTLYSFYLKVQIYV